MGKYDTGGGDSAGGTSYYIILILERETHPAHPHPYPVERASEFYDDERWADVGIRTDVRIRKCHDGLWADVRIRK